MFSLLLGIYLRVKSMGPYGNSVFNHLRSCLTAFRSDCTVVRSCQRCMKISVSPHPQHLLPSVFLIIAVLVGGKCYLTCAFIFSFKQRHIRRGLFVLQHNFLQCSFRNHKAPVYLKQYMYFRRNRWPQAALSSSTHYKGQSAHKSSPPSPCPKDPVCLHREAPGYLCSSQRAESVAGVLQLNSSSALAPARKTLRRPGVMWQQVLVCVPE